MIPQQFSVVAVVIISFWKSIKAHNTGIGITGNAMHTCCLFVRLNRLLLVDVVILRAYLAYS